MKPSDEKQVAEYIRKLRWALSKLPGQDRDEIVNEAESHFHERLSDESVAFETVANDLGHPEDYARSFLGNYEISVALGSGSPWHMMMVAFKSAGKGLVAFLGSIWFFILYGSAFVFAAMAVFKPIFPRHVGLWHKEGDQLSLGISTENAGLEELLGYWIIPLSALAAVLLFVLANWMLRVFLRKIRR